MILGCLPSWGSSIHNLAETGQHGRLLNYYFPHYLHHFERIYHFSYIAEEISEYTDNSHLKEKIRLIGNDGPFGRRAYIFAMAHQQRIPFQECAIFRVFQATGSWPAILAKALYNTPYVTTYGFRYAALAREIGTAWWKVSVYSFLERLALRFADGVIVTTRELESYVSAFVPTQKIYFIPNGVDTRSFRPSDIEKRRSPYFEVVFVGRFEVQKDLPTLIKALEILKGEGIECHLQLVGEGSLHDQLAQQAEEKGLKINFLGVIPHENLPEVLNRADVFVLPSIREGHPKSLIEAMSCGLPCVVSDCDGNRTLVSNSVSGLIFPVSDHQKLAEQLRLVFTRSELADCIGRNARQSIVENYDIHSLLDRETNLLAELAMQKARVS